jgi:hypothetical protein
MTAEFWQYDARLGRRWNVDPMSQIQPGQGPYCAYDNRPIWKNDPKGGREIRHTTYEFSGSNVRQALNQIATPNK